MTIHLPEDLERFVQTEVSKGHFASADEAISQAVQLLRQRAQQLTEDEWEQRPGAIRPSGPYSAPPLRRCARLSPCGFRASRSPRRSSASAADMTAYFCDASGIAKRYLHETGTAWVQALANPIAGNRLFLARITTVEVVSAVTRAPARRTSFARRSRRYPGAVPPRPGRRVRHHRNHPCPALPCHDPCRNPCPALTTPCSWLPPWISRPAAPPSACRRSLLSADRDLNLAATASGVLVEDPTLHP